MSSQWMQAVWTKSKTIRESKLVLMALADGSNLRGITGADTTLKFICARSGLSRSGAQRVMKRLTQSNKIRLVRKHVWYSTPTGEGLPPVYEIIEPEVVELANYLVSYDPRQGKKTPPQTGRGWGERSTPGGGERSTPGGGERSTPGGGERSTPREQDLPFNKRISSPSPSPTAKDPMTVCVADAIEAWNKLQAWIEEDRGASQGREDLDLDARILKSFLFIGGFRRWKAWREREKDFLFARQEFIDHYRGKIRPKAS